MKKILLTALSFVLLSIPLRAQTLKAYMSAADEAFDSAQYYPALVYYSNAMEFDTENLDVVYKTAEAARNFSAFSLAEGYYQKVLDNDSENSYPLAAYNLGEVKQKQAKYEEARDAYKLYLSEHNGEDEYYTAKANKEIKACDFAEKAINNPNPRYTLNYLGESVNTGDSDVGPRVINDKLYYSSMRNTNEGDYDKPADKFSRIYESEEGGNGKLMNNDINNTTLNVAHLTHNTEGTRAYYSVCTNVSDVELMCDLYYRDIDSDGKYGNAVKLPDHVNAPSASTTQPSIAFDAEKNNDVLYFVSNRENPNPDKGKKDIWYTVIDSDGSFSQPTPLNEINTSENDESPFYHLESGALYFASQGYQGMGGYDIYKSYHNNGSFGTPNVMPAPVNSSFNDAHYWLSEDGLTAYFSTDRHPSSIYSDAEYEACCYDIYKLDIKELKLKLNVETFDKKTSLPLDSCIVGLYDPSCSTLIEEKVGTTSNFFEFDIVADKNYCIITDRGCFGSDTIKLSTRGITESQTIKRKSFLTPECLFLKVLPVDKSTGEPLAGAKVRVGDLPPQEDAIATSYDFMIEPGTEYDILGTKLGYNAGRNKVEADESATKTFIVKIVELDRYPWLPLTLYFDNDYPNPRSTRTFTRNKYSDTYTPYYAKKETFKRNFSAPLSGDEKEAAAQRVDEFFELNVKAGGEKLQLFLASLLKHLQTGERLEISIRGYTSPLASGKYNLALGQRRVSSVRNEIEAYMDGVFKDYLNPVNGGEPQLVITDISYGKTTAPPEVSSSSTDKRNSVYSVEASKERRVQIIRVESID
jgi:hypothetical protein